MNHQAKYDYIVVGSGTSGSIVASRLSEDPTISVLVIEAGGSDKHPMITMPGALPFVYQNKKIGWGIQSGPEPHLNNRTIDEKAGKVVGGSSSINAMIFNRGNPMDYEGWASDGLSNWNYAHCLPYFKKMETFEEGESAWRGGSGPMFVNRSSTKHKLFDAFMEAGVQAGFEITPDHNGYKQEGLHSAQTFVHRGIRWSAPKGHLYPAIKRGNVTLLKRALVNRIIFEGNVAIGVELTSKTGTQKVRVNREVILAAGAMNSPKLLMLSGIGDRTELERLGIRCVAHRPQVGKNLQNHPGVDIQYSTNAWDSLTAKLTTLGRIKMGLQWIFTRKGLGTTNFFEAGAFLRTRPDVTFPNMQYEFLPLTRKLHKGKVVPIPGFQLWMDLSRPQSRGEITLKSKDPQDPPKVVFRHYENYQDMQDMIDGIRLARKIISQKAFDAFRGEELQPGSYVQSDAELEKFVREKTGTSYHPSGACRMGVDEDAVVDAEGRVNGVQNLRVVDASIMPRVITGNLNAPVMMMAEKLADAIAGRTPLPPSDAGFYFKE